MCIGFHLGRVILFFGEGEFKKDTGQNRVIAEEKYRRSEAKGLKMITL